MTEQSDELSQEIGPATERFVRTRRAAWTGAVLAVLLICAFTLIPVPYVMLSPGPMYNTIGTINGVELIQISGTTTYPSTGQLDMVTVDERGGPSGPMSLPEAFIGWLSPDLRVVPEEFLYSPNVSAQDAKDQSAAQFTSSQSKAIAASMGYLKLPVTVETFVAQLVPDGPAQGHLQVGDVIEKVDGTPIKAPEEVPPIVKAHKPGSTVMFSIKRTGQPMDVSVVTAPSPTDPANAYIGITVGGEYTAPFPITFGLEDVGGPSAGLMFSLGIIDKLTPGDLSGGKAIAGTGTIDTDGSVGPIGGIEQKLISARNNNIELFLAPADNCEAAAAADSGDVTIAKISTLSEAVSVIEKFRSGSTDFAQCK